MSWIAPAIECVAQRQSSFEMIGSRRFATASRRPERLNSRRSHNDYVLPGLIDAHVHLWGIAGDPLRAQLEQLTRDRFDDMVEAEKNARLDLEAGFTTVRDLEADPRGIRALRDAIDAGDVEGPTIVNSGAQISVTGGHADLSAGMGEDFADAVRAKAINICDGPDDCRRAVRAQIALGAEVIKFAATGGVLSNVAGGLGQQMTLEEMKAIVETAHSFGRKVAAPVTLFVLERDGTKAALEAGVDLPSSTVHFSMTKPLDCSRSKVHICLSRQ